MMNTKALIAMLAGLMGGTVDPRFLPTERRTVKVRPANYTHPMVVSSERDITVWNGKVKQKKLDRSMQRQRTARAMRDWLQTSGGGRLHLVKPHVSKTTAYLRKETDAILDARVTAMHLDILSV